MSFSRKSYRTRTAGFSLIEVLITVVVLGIIMSIVVSTLLRARDKARQGATIADMRNLSTAIEAYTVDHSLPPDTMIFTDVAQLLKLYHNQRVPVNDHWVHHFTPFQASHPSSGQWRSTCPPWSCASRRALARSVSGAIPPPSAPSVMGYFSLITRHLRSLVPAACRGTCAQ